MFTSWYIVDVQGTERTRNQLTNLLWHILMRFLLHLVFNSKKPPLSNCTAYSWKKIVGYITLKSLFFAGTYLYVFSNHKQSLHLSHLAYETGLSLHIQWLTIPKFAVIRQPGMCHTEPYNGAKCLTVAFEWILRTSLWWWNQEIFVIRW